MYEPYFGVAQSMRLEAKLSRQKMKRDELATALDGLFITSCMSKPGIISTASITIILESIHYLLDHRTYYVSSNLARKLAETDVELDIEAFKQMHLPSRVFEVCFNDLKINGHKIPSALVTAGLDDTYRNMMNEFIERNTAIINEELNRSRKEIGMKSVPYTPPKITSDRFKIDYSLGTDALYHCVIPLDDDNFTGKNITEIIESLGVICDTAKLSPEEVETQKYLARIIFGLICYINLPEPDMQKHKDHSRAAIGPNRPQIFMLGKKETECSWHLRKGHWRILKHERYKRNEDGTIKTIWVRPTEVNKGHAPAMPDNKIEILDG